MVMALNVGTAFAGNTGAPTQWDCNSYGLKFGSETRTPAMQAGLVKKRLTFRDVFTSSLVSVSPGKIIYLFGDVESGPAIAA